MADRFTFESDKHGAGQLRVLRFSGAEGISQIYRYELTLSSTSAELDLDAMIGGRALLRVGGSDSHRVVHGVITAFEQKGVTGGDDEHVYRAVLQPTVAPLGVTLGTNTFQAMSTIEIVKQVLAQAKLPSSCLRINLRESQYEKRDFCVQYQESDLAFICRLLAEEGISFCFEHSDQKDVMVLFDDSTAASAVPRAETLTYQKHHHSPLDPEGITELGSASALFAGAAMMRDFRFIHPDLSDMQVTESGQAFTNLSRYYYPGEYVDPKLGERLVRVRLQEQQWTRHTSVGKANAPALISGYKFRLKGHPRSASNQEYLVVSFRVAGASEHGDDESSFGIEDLLCIPAGVPFRPPLLPRPCVAGVHTAIVVGPAGEEIHCDKYGRVRVRFHWDRRTDRQGDHSCWIRVSQPWGGNAYGGMFMPRVGQEVIVEFIAGDPDRPIIIGRVYNGDSPVPYGLPDAKTRSTLRTSSSPGGSGFNELRFEDAANNEEVYVHAQRNFKKEILKDSDTTIGGDHTETIDGKSTEKIKKDWIIGVDGNRETTIGGNDELTVKKDQTSTIEGNRSASVRGNDKLDVDKDQSISIQGNQNETIGKKLTQQVSGDISQSTDANLTVHAAKNISISADGDVTISGKNITLRGDQKVTITVGDNTITLSSSGISVEGSKVRINGQGGTMIN